MRGTVLAFSSGGKRTESCFDLSGVELTVYLEHCGAKSVRHELHTSFGNYNYNLATNALGFWLQDDWKISPRLTLNLGLRYDNDLGIFNPDLT